MREYHKGMNLYLEELNVKRDCSSSLSCLLSMRPLSRSGSTIVQTTYPLPSLSDHTLLSLTARLGRRVACRSKDKIVIS
jgi:hypothetical protein